MPHPSRKERPLSVSSSPSLVQSLTDHPTGRHSESGVMSNTESESSSNRGEMMRNTIPREFREEMEREREKLRAEREEMEREKEKKRAELEARERKLKAREHKLKASERELKASEQQIARLASIRGDRGGHQSGTSQEVAAGIEQTAKEMRIKFYKYQDWLKNSQMQVEGKDFRDNFTTGFGFEGDPNREKSMRIVIERIKEYVLKSLSHNTNLNTEEEQYRRALDEWKSMKEDAERIRIARPILDQPVCITGREREGKTGGILSIVKAARDLGCAVLVFVAPTKVAPVKDMTNKLRRAGFSLVASTLRKDPENPGASSNILVCGLTNHRDIEKAHIFIRDHKSAGQPTVAILDECDELTMGRGRSTVKLSAGSLEPSNFSDDESILSEAEDSSTDEEMHKEVAKSEHLFRYLVQPSALIFLVTATQIATYVKKISFFDLEQPATFLRVRKSLDYAGIDNIEIPPGFEIERGKYKGNLLEHPMLQHFAERRNPHDGTKLELSEEGKRIQSQADTELFDKPTLEGSFFISVSQSVNVGPMGAHSLCEQVCNNCQHLRATPIGAVHPRRPLAICFVGNPRAYTTGKESFELKRGATLEKMICCSKEHWSCLTFTHIVFIGYTLTRRSMTATFFQDNKLVTPMYGFVCNSKSSKVDADSQRFLRVGHEFGQWRMPSNYKIHVACNPETLEDLKNYRRLENLLFELQQSNPKPMGKFCTNLPVFEFGLEASKVSKKGIPLNSFDERGRRKKMKREQDVYMISFGEWMSKVPRGRSGGGYAMNTMSITKNLLNKAIERLEKEAGSTSMLTLRDAAGMPFEKLWPTSVLDKLPTQHDRDDRWYTYKRLQDWWEDFTKTGAEDPFDTVVEDEETRISNTAVAQQLLQMGTGA